MGVSYNPSTVTSGLVLCLDAGNTKSYPGSGTAWSDLSGRRIDASLVNGPSYSSSNGGAILFDGTDDYCTTNNTFSTLANNLFADANGAWSVSAWFKFPVSPSGTRTGNASWMVVGRAGGIATAATFAIFVGSATDTTYGPYAPYYCACVVRGAVTIISPASVNDDVWHNVVVTWNGTSGKMYFDSIDRGSFTVGTAAVQSGNVVVVGSNGGTSHTFQGSISNTLIHNRSLSAAEVTQNFNATRSRYGI